MSIYIYTCHPLDKDVDVSFVLSGSKTTHDVGVTDPPQCGNFVPESGKLLLLLRAGVTGITNLDELDTLNKGHIIRIQITSK